MMAALLRASSPALLPLAAGGAMGLALAHLVTTVCR